MRIFYFHPYNHDRKDIFESYDNIMSLLTEPDDWACILDGDAMFTTRNFGNQIKDIIEANPEYDLFTCMTNRVACKYQLVLSEDGDDIAKHRVLGNEAYYFWNDVQDITHSSPLSGVMILTNKQAWDELQQNVPKPTGMLGVDNLIHKAYAGLGMKVGLMRGVYVYHWYNGGGKRTTDHLK